MFSSLAVKGGITLALMAIIAVSVAVVARNWSCRKPRPPRPPKVESFDVVSVPTGNSIIVKAGRRDRTITVTLKGIGVPNLPGAQEAARASLERLAGKKIKAEVPRRWLRGETADEEFVKIESEWDSWYPEHKKSCSQCSSGVSSPLCEEAFTKLQEILRSERARERYRAWFKEHCETCKICSTEPTPENPIPAFCDEIQTILYDNFPEARSDFISPQAWGETGLCLQLEQLRAGLAISVGDVPKTWAKAEAAAKKAGRGIWK